MCNIIHTGISNFSFSNKRLIFLMTGFLLLLLSGFSVKAQGNLILLQKRVVFEGSENIMILDYGNIGLDTATYTVSLMNLRMNEDGKFTIISVADSLQLFADPYIRIYPRSMEIGPGESQSMKIQLINNHNMVPGEYRSHLYFRANQDGKTKTGSADRKQEEVSVSVKTEFGISIPVIIRVGESTTSVQLNDISIEQTDDKSHLLNFSIQRSGNFSSYGHIAAIHISPNGKETEVGSVMGVAVYTPGTIRHCKLALSNTQGVNLKDGKIRVRYTLPKEDGGAVLAESELELNGKIKSEMGLN